MQQATFSNVILHAFDWPYELVKQRAQKIQEMGYRSVLISPPLKSLKSEEGTPWWQRYQPQDYRVIDNQLGDTHDFVSMLEELKKYQISVYVDVVFNHMANESGIRKSLVYPGPREKEEYQCNRDHYHSLTLFGDLNQPLFEEEDFIEAFGIQDWHDKWEVQNGRITGGTSDPGLPTLKDTDRVVKAQQNYLSVLKKMGVKGFRIDAAKHMSLEHMDKVWSEEICKDMHIFGEIITDGGATNPEYDIFLEPFLAYTPMSAYDFPLFQTMFNAFKPKGSLKSLVDPYCFGMSLSKTRAITFAITHDIPNNTVFENLVMSEKQEALAYHYLLGRDGGVPLIYTDLDTSRFKDRKGQPRWLNAWCDPDMKSRIAFSHQMHGLPMSTLEATESKLIFSRGDIGVVALNKARCHQTIKFKAKGVWKDVLSDKIYHSRKGKVEFKLAAMSGVMLVKQEEQGH